MAQIQNTYQHFGTNDTVTATSLNDLIDKAVLTKDAIHTQDEKLLPALADELLIYDVAGTRLARATVANILSNTGANVPSVNGLANADISINPNDGVTVTGKVYNSANGVLVTVTTAPDLHGLTSGQFVQVTATDGNYSGTYQITVTSTTTFTYTVSMNTVWNKTATNVYGSTLVTVASVGHGLANGQSVIVSGPIAALNGTYGITISGADAFTYVLSSAPYTATSPATTLTTTVNYIRNGYVAGSGTCSYTKSKSVVVVGNESISGKLYAAGDISTSGKVQAASMKVGGPVEVYGAVNVSGSINADSLSVSGKSVTTLVNDGTTKTYVKFGTASGATGGGSVQYNVYALPTLGTIPSDETWTYEFFMYATAGNANGNTRPTFQGVNMHIYNDATLLADVYGSSSPYGGVSFCAFHALNGVTGAKYIIKTSSQSGCSVEPRYLVRLTKFKTANLSDAALCI